jgi:prepilin peptidase CpaA
MILQILVLSLFTAVMAVAAFEDFRRLTIPNLMPLLLCAAWPFYVAAAPLPGGTLGAALGAAGCALAVFLGGAVLFARGWLGGGDVKLLSAATLWAGAPQALGLLVVTGLLGGALALILLSPFGKFASPARRLLGPPYFPPSHPGAPESTAPVPYGVAIAGAGVIVVVSPHIA